MNGRKKTIFDRLTFRGQLTVIFFSGILFLALVTTLVVNNVSGTILRNHQLQQALQVTESLALQSEIALLYQSSDSAREIAERTNNFPGVKGIAIETDTGNVLYSSSNKIDALISGDKPAELSMVREEDNYWVFVSPVYSVQFEENELGGFDPGESQMLLGYVTMMVGKDTLILMQSSILKNHLSISIGIAVVILALLLAVSRRLTKPIEKLSQTMKKAQEGESWVRSEIGGTVEVTDMQGSFNTMMEVLKNRQIELQNAMQAALESARVKGEFAANVTHELRTPMNAVLGMLDLLMTMGLSPKQKEYVETAKSAGNNLLQLIDEILNFSEVDAGKITIEEEEYFVDEILDDVISLLASQGLKKQVDIGYLIKGSIPASVNIDGKRIRQVLINLIGNAIKFTDSGEVRIEVSSESLEVVDKNNVILHFDVIDTGIGISEEDQAKIFEAFTQADSSSTKAYQGTGLGLAISKQIVELMGGKITVSSEQGVGSQFSFSIPVEVLSEKLLGTKNTQFDGLSALVVTGSSVVSRFIADKFSQLSINVSAVDSGVDALSEIRQSGESIRPVDLLIIDEELQDIKIADLLDFVHEEPRVRDSQLVVLTNPWLTDHELLNRPSTKLNKPLQSQSINQLLKTCLNKDVKPTAASETQNVSTSAASVIPSGDVQVPTAEPEKTYKVLVVDDNRANQQVAQGMLENLGCYCEVVSNGQEAVDQVIRGRFDLVLMDCNMPVMDGYDATRQIRKYEGAESGKLPILAMTANNSQKEIDKCEDVGMSDFLPKPLSLQSLGKQLERWLGEISGEESIESGSAVFGPAVGHQGLSYDREILGELQDAVGEVFTTMIEAFLEDTPVYLQTLKSAVAEKNARQIRELAHTVKGSASNFGATQVVTLSKSLEDKATSEQLTDANILLDELFEAFSYLKQDLEKAFLKPEENDGAQGEENFSILIVDDDRSIRMGLANVLKEDDYQIIEAQNGSQAINFCKRSMPDLILMDAMMPEMDGFTACQMIRELPNGSDIPVLMITGLDNEESIVRAFSAGATDYITKPIHFSVLKQRVTRLIKANKAEKRVKRLAYHDSLTGLPNRANLNQQLNVIVNRAEIEQKQVALLFLDLDRFKMINDTMGHDAGDLLLKAVADRIRSCVREQDFIARLGGDEFTVVLEGISEPGTAARIAEEICHHLSQPFVFLQQKMFVSASIGISMYPDDGKDVSSLIKHADSAMFKAKEERNNYCFYETGMEDEIAQRLELERELRHAIEHEELVLHYQPKVDLTSGELVGAEALVRWEHPERGLLSPFHFIPLAEETGLINQLSDWVLEEAANQMRLWNNQGQGMSVAVNLSSKDLLVGDIHNKLRSLIHRYQLPRNVLEIEITESMLMEKPEVIEKELKKIQDMGITIAIDDFGSGYSSLNYLKRLPVDVLKIDRSFVCDIEADPNDSAIVTGVVALAKSFNLKTVAEGVETERQREILQGLNCDYYQGFLYSKPVSAQEFEQRFFSLEPVEQTLP